MFVFHKKKYEQYQKFEPGLSWHGMIQIYYFHFFKVLWNDNNRYSLSGHACHYQGSIFLERQKEKTLKD